MKGNQNPNNFKYDTKIRLQRKHIALLLLRIRENKRKIRIYELMNEGNLANVKRMKASLGI